MYDMVKGNYRYGLLFFGLLLVAAVLTVPAFKSTNTTTAQAESNDGSSIVQSSGGCGVPGQMQLAQADENECEEDPDCHEKYDKCHECNSKGNCVDNCNRDFQKCDGGDCVNVCDPEDKPEEGGDTCYRCDFESGEWVDTPPSACHKCVNGDWIICPGPDELCVNDICEECKEECPEGWKKDDCSTTNASYAGTNWKVTCNWKVDVVCKWSNEHSDSRPQASKSSSKTYGDNEQEGRPDCDELCGSGELKSVPKPDECPPSKE